MVAGSGSVFTLDTLCRGDTYPGRRGIGIMSLASSCHTTFMDDRAPILLLRACHVLDLRSTLRGRTSDSSTGLGDGVRESPRDRPRVLEWGPGAVCSSASSLSTLRDCSVVSATSTVMTFACCRRGGVPLLFPGERVCSSWPGGTDAARGRDGRSRTLCFVCLTGLCVGGSRPLPHCTDSERSATAFPMVRRVNHAFWLALDDRNRRGSTRSPFLLAHLSVALRARTAREGKEKAPLFNSWMPGSKGPALSSGASHCGPCSSSVQT